MPSYPAFILLLASLVFLVPAPPARALRRSPDAARPPRAGTTARLALLGAAAAVFALYPLALVAARARCTGRSRAPTAPFGLLRSIDPALR